MSSEEFVSSTDELIDTKKLEELKKRDDLIISTDILLTVKELDPNTVSSTDEVRGELRK